MVLASIEAIRSALGFGARRAAATCALTLGAVACAVYEPALLPQEVGVASAGAGNGATATGGQVANAQAGGDPSPGGAEEGGAAPAGGAPSSAGTAGASTGGCGGVVYAQMCWYLGERGQSCDATCARHGAADERGASVVGTPAQGGSVDGCSQVLERLGMKVSPTAAMRRDVGLGCHLYDSEPFWLDAPRFATDASQVSSRIVCACQR